MQIRDNILSIFAKHRRVLEGEDAENFSSKIKQTIETFIKNKQPLEVVLPAFPDKSIVRDKALSNKADMAEKITIKHFKQIISEVDAVYPHGMNMIIYSDGGVFHGMCDKGYTKEDRLNYIATLKKFIQDEGLEQKIKIIDTENFKDMLDRNGYTEDLNTLKNKVKTDKNTNALYVGQKYF